MQIDISQSIKNYYWILALVCYLLLLLLFVDLLLFILLLFSPKIRSEIYVDGEVHS